MENLNLTHYNDGKGKYQSHEVSILEASDFYKDFEDGMNDLCSHEIMNIYGWGETKEEALENFKIKFNYLLSEMEAFGKILNETDVLNSMIEVDCFKKPI